MARMTAMRLMIVMVLLHVAARALPESDGALEHGQRLTTDLFHGRYETIWRQMTPEMQKAIGSEAALGRFMEKVRAEAGTEKDVIRESIQQQAELETYLRYSRFDRMPNPVVVSFSFTPDRRIADFYVRPLQRAAESPYLDYQTRADLRLPFDGAWYVFWGGRSVARNYHAAAKDQRFAYDFVVEENGTTHRGEGTMNEDYHCWGRPILAPAEATVISVERLLPDNPPGVLDPRNPAGNHVMLDLGEGEYALLAHMQADSIVVEEGDELEAGQLIGLCGNSGNTSEPHLHFHLQDEPEFGKGRGLPAYFNHYRVNGERVARGEPLQGQTVAAAPTETASATDDQ
jgi:Peptidase family M23